MRTNKIGVNAPGKQVGFNLIELMVAIALGILISIGLVTMFGATSKANHLQDALAQLQENGRYAMTRMSMDLRMAARQQISISGFTDVTANPITVNGVATPAIAADVYVPSFTLPDSSGALTAPVGWTAGQWPLSPANFTQGYECSSGACTPAVPASLPTAGTVVNRRVPGSDVLTVRYLDADGWTTERNELTELTSSGSSDCSGGTLTSLTVNPYAGNASVTPAVPAGAAFNFASGDLALLVTATRAVIFQVSVAGNVLTPTNLIAGTSIPCFTTGGSVAGSTTLYNFSRDFVSVTYFLQLDTDPDNATRLIPGLYRRRSTIAVPNAPANTQELVQGVDQLDFLYGLEDRNGAVSYVTANQVAGAPNCPAAPVQYGVAFEPGCMWRAIKNIEVHALFDSVHNASLTASDTAYRYQWNYSGTDTLPTPAVAGTTLPNGLRADSVMRREFISLISIRNYN